MNLLQLFEDPRILPLIAESISQDFYLEIEILKANVEVINFIGNQFLDEAYSSVEKALIPISMGLNSFSQNRRDFRHH